MTDRASRPWGTIWACFAIGSLGLILLIWALLAQPDGWLPNVLVEIGATLLLFAPLLFVGKRVEKRLGEVQTATRHIEGEQEKTAASIANLAVEVQQSIAELRAERDPMSDAVLSRLAVVREKDDELFGKVNSERTRESTFGAVQRAAEIGLIYSRGCRVQIFDTDVCAWFEPYDGDDHFDVGYFVQLEHWGGGQIERIRWQEDMSAEDLLLAVGQSMQRAGRYPGDENFDPGRIFTDLQTMLDFAHARSRRSGSSGRPLPPLVEICAPQWAITESSIVSLDPNNWREIHMQKIYETDWHTKISKESWVNRDSFDTAFDRAKSLYEMGRLAVRPPFSDEPPF